MSSFLPFSHQSEADVGEFDVSDLLQEVGEALERESLRRRVPIEIDAPPYTMVRGDRQTLRLLLTRLISNALSASPPGGEIVVTAYSDEQGVEVEVADDRSESVELLIDSGLVAVAGTGDVRAMPWSEVQRVAAACGGRISIAPCPEGGVAMSVQFPRLSDADTSSRRAA
ncbi:MAG: HAMP domain-containing histidine kinase [Candidatus Anammoximicrobium sp.]|nr:HAMP domain-containing histidine kinase [Candidatus Anammoximicrobium sp.]